MSGDRPFRGSKAVTEHRVGDTVRESATLLSAHLQNSGGGLSCQKCLLTLQGSNATPVTSPTATSPILSIFEHLPSSFVEGKAIHTRLPAATALDFRWYLEWLIQQVQNLPDCLIDLIRDQDKLNTIDFAPCTILCRIFIAVNRFVRKSQSPSIDEVIEHLQEERIFELAGCETAQLPAQRLLVFAILGWQTMLYLPSFNTCSLAQLEIHQHVGQPNSRLVYDTFRMSADLADRPLAILLKGYGNLLPSRCRGLPTVASETSRVASSWNAINVTEMNAYCLFSYLNVKINWVDTLALHLDYDKSSRTLSLFKYPSLCVATLETNGALYAFSSPDSSGLDPRADFVEITEILQETLLSYRLLFGQKQASRKYFRQLAESNPSLFQNPDTFLHQICTTKVFSHPAVPQDRFIYFAHRDFPVLGERVEMLEKEIRGTKPKGWKHLVRDRRDTGQYWTFWLFAIFGISSLVLSLAQVITSAYSLAKK